MASGQLNAPQIFNGGASRGLVSAVGVAERGWCEELAERVFSLRRHWIPRGFCGENGGFATLGCASYLDVSNSDCPQRDYYDRCGYQNDLLGRHFADLLKRVLDVLGTAVSSAISTSDELALPGFHIFWGTSLVDVPTPELCHFDTQFQSLRWHGRWGRSAPRSFTLPIRLPRGGASVDLWPVTYAEFLGGPWRSRSAREYVLSPEGSCQTHWYELGSLTIQNDLWLHRIGRSGSRSATDFRITLQGHALEVDNRWIVYW